MAKAKRVKKAAPVPVKQDGRICFGIDYYATEEDAQVAAAIVREQGRTYNGGYFHGMPCGREEHRDYVDPETGKKLFAVTN